MDASSLQPPKEETVSVAICSVCGGTMLQEYVVCGKAVPIKHRRITGTFVQFVDGNGDPFGPMWPMCHHCQRNPLDLPEVQAAYQSALEKQQCL